MRGYRAFRVGAAAAALAALCSCFNPAGSSKGGSTATLAKYGIVAVAAKGSADPQPYGTKIAAVLSRQQIYFDGLTYSGDEGPTLVDYRGGVASVDFTDSDDGWTLEPHASIAARLGSDGKQSIVSVVFTPKNSSYTTGDNPGTVSIEVWKGATATKYTPFAGTSGETFDLYLCGWGGNWNKQLNNEPPPRRGTSRATVWTRSVSASATGS